MGGLHTSPIVDRFDGGSIAGRIAERETRGEAGVVRESGLVLRE